MSSGNSSSGIFKAGFFSQNMLHEVQVQNRNLDNGNSFRFDDPILLTFKFHVEEKYLQHVEIGFRITDQKERVVFTSQNKVANFKKGLEGYYEIQSLIPNKILVPNEYRVSVGLHVPNVTVLSFQEDAVTFSIEETGTDFFQYAGNDYGCVFVDCKWS
tara:strand:- start:302 stop:775 length:474 start_codon:yes stop_codon:yes gene_type:complete